MPDSDPPMEPEKPSLSASERTRAWLAGLTSSASERLKNVEILSLIEWTSKALQRKGASILGRLLTILLSTFFLSNVLALLLGNKLIPEPPTALPVSTGSVRRFKTLEDYSVIFTRNLFNSKGIIPGEEMPAGGPANLGGPAVRTSLSFNLIGTLILENEVRSIATIEDKSASMVYPVQVGDEIPSKAKITKIEPNKVTFLNTSSGRLEYVDLPEETQTNNPRITLGSRPRTGGGGIEQVSPNSFNIPKVEIDKAMADINNILTQARAVPNFENGVPNGYKLFQIVPGSIYSKLGFQNGDVVTMLDGEPANDPGKALGALQSLKDKKHFEIAGKRDGRPFTYSYDFQ